ncbi:MAG TPA: sugar nucleotide-binding protein, partial [Rhodanobacteraceae bacterium]|nr:sugar nucleotide-binding protein [Rhodanobacteraceae bacterium]
GDMTGRSRDGVYHLTSAGQTSWCEFARAIFVRADRAGLLPRVPRVEAIGTRDYPTRARRPAYSVLDTSLLRGTFGVDLPDWRDGLDGVFEDLAG